MTVLDVGPPRPRMCTIVKRADFSGYGFNLHAEKTKPGIQYIGQVDENSPAEAAGLKEGDKIIEVNGVNIEHENHKQVVERIRADSNQTKLLVVDKLTENYHKENGIIITGYLEYVEHISSERNIQPIVEEEPDSRGSSPVSDTSSSPGVRPDSRIRKDSVNSDRTLSNRSSVSSRQGETIVGVGVHDVPMLRTETAEVVETIIPPSPVITPPTPELRVHHEEDTFNHDVSTSGVASAPPPAIPGIREESESESDEGHESGDDNRSNHNERYDNRSNYGSSVRNDPATVAVTTTDFEDRNDYYYKQDSVNEEIHVTTSTIGEHVDDRDDTTSNSSSSSEESNMYVVEQPKEGIAVIHEQDEIVVAGSSAAKEDDARKRGEDTDSSSSKDEEVVADPPPRYSNISEEGVSISSGSPRSTPSPSEPSRATDINKPKPVDGLNLPMTAREMREMLSSRKKRDPRKDGGMDFRRKFDIIQAL